MSDESQEIQEALKQAAQAVEDSLPTLAEFLVSTPLLEMRSVKAPLTYEVGKNPTIGLPPIQLHCSSEQCGGLRAFDPYRSEISLWQFDARRWHDHIVDYACRNCRQSRKTFALRIKAESKTAQVVDMLKFGEIPAFGEPRPNLIKDVLDDEIEYLDRGYRAETAGLGIGAFAYYRRFVESHKNKIISEIRKVAAVQGAKQDVLDTLDQALKTNSFDAAVKAVKDAIPDSLRYQGGHNPLTLLHSALSGGLHSDDDVECLELAKDIRLLLTDLAERTTQALKNNAELGQAVSRLLNKGVRV